MKRGGAARLRLAAGLIVLAALVERVGLTPFLDGLARVDAGTFLLGLLLGLPTTMCCAWRWTLVAQSSGVRLPMRQAVAAYYRSQLVNTALPGGVLGDVHRGARHGRETGDTRQALRTVFWERALGQLVLVGVTCLVLLAVPSPIATWLPCVGLLAVAAATIVVVHAKVLSAHIWPRVLLASLGALIGPSVTFLVAARTVGVTTPLTTLLPLLLLVLLAMAVPLNVAGWGPREGAAAWAFAAIGVGAEAGVATAVVYGIMTLVAVLPGVLVLLAAPGRALSPDSPAPRAEAVRG